MSDNNEEREGSTPGATPEEAARALYTESERRTGGRTQAAPRPSGSLLGAVVAETIGTFILVFFGAGALVALNRPVGGPNTPQFEALTLTVGLAFGIAVLITVYAFGHVSGAHINPTVTIGLAVVRRFPWKAVPPYLFAQFFGAVAASFALLVLFGSNAKQAPLLLGATAPGPRGPAIAFIAEVILGFLLMVVVLATATDERAIPAGSGLAIGLVIGAGVIVALNVSGGSFNAARSLGPMIVSGQFPAWLVYLFAPTLGGVLGALCYDFLARPGAPPESEEELLERGS